MKLSYIIFFPGGTFQGRLIWCQVTLIPSGIMYTVHTLCEAFTAIMSGTSGLLVTPGWGVWTDSRGAASAALLTTSPGAAKPSCWGQWGEKWTWWCWGSFAAQKLSQNIRRDYWTICGDCCVRLLCILCTTVPKLKFFSQYVCKYSYFPVIIITNYFTSM